jgi:hypothetical protein
MDTNCLSCHREIRQRMDQGKGLHSRVGDKTCAACHPDHAGRDFELIFWGEGGKGGEAGFDHSRTGWILQGKHAKTECRACHTTKFQKDPVAPLIRRKPPAKSWLGLPTDCLSCHQDPHRGSFGPDCASCHGFQSWGQLANATTFPHDRTRFPLRGRHARVECAKCHDPVKAWGKKPAFAQCSSCHEDAHAGTAILAGAKVDCASCHNEMGYRPSTYTVAQHEKSAYALLGKHKTVPCGSCHTRTEKPSGTGRRGTAGVDLRPAHQACRSCHSDAHGRQLAAREDKGACESCHTVEGWTPTTVTAAGHAPLRFPLDGAHVEAECRSCHGPNRKGLPNLPGPEVLGNAGVLLAFPEITCQSCHVDAHEGRYTGNEVSGKPSPDFADCRSCHTTWSFHATLVDVSLHARFSYPLEGAHRAVPCVLCHRELGHSPAASTLLKAGNQVPRLLFHEQRTQCSQCHETPHGDQFTLGKGAKACEGCHDVTTFRPATRFDHNRDASFSLAGAHERVPCRRCHPTRADANGKGQVLYKPLAANCESCHGG